MLSAQEHAEQGHMSTQQEGGWPGEGARQQQTLPAPCGASTLAFPGSRTVRNAFLLFTLPNDGALSEQPRLATTRPAQGQPLGDSTVPHKLGFSRKAFSSPPSRGHVSRIVLGIKLMQTYAGL